MSVHLQYIACVTFLKMLFISVNSWFDKMHCYWYLLFYSFEEALHFWRSYLYTQSIKQFIYLLFSFNAFWWCRSWYFIKIAGDSLCFNMFIWYWIMYAFTDGIWRIRRYLAYHNRVLAHTELIPSHPTILSNLYGIQAIINNYKQFPRVNINTCFIIMKLVTISVAYSLN